MAVSARQLLIPGVVSVLFLQPSSVLADTLDVSNDTSIVSCDAAGDVATFVSGLNYPSGLAYYNGNIYEADYGSNSLLRIALNGQIQTVTTALNSPVGVAVDQSGNIYEADSGTDSILKITPAGQISTFASGLGAYALTFDTTGDLYATDTNNNSIVKITPTGQTSTFATGLNSPTALAFDSQGNLYVSEFLNDDILKMNSAGTSTVFASGLNEPEGLAFDKQGNLFEADYGSNTIFEYNALGAQSTFANVTDPFGMVFVPAAVPETGTILIAFLGFLSIRLLMRRHA